MADDLALATNNNDQTGTAPQMTPIPGSIPETPTNIGQSDITAPALASDTTPAGPPADDLTTSATALAEQAANPGDAWGEAAAEQKKSLLYQQKIAQDQALIRQETQVMGDFNANKPAVPQLQQPSQAPQAKPPLSQGDFLPFVTLFGALAAMSSKGTAAPALTALNTMGAAVEGYQKGDAEAAKRNMDNWIAQTDQIIKTNQVKVQQYDMVLNDAKMTTEQKIELLKDKALLNDDMMKYHLLDAGHYEEAIKANDAHRMAAAQLAEKIADVKKKLGTTGATLDEDDLKRMAGQVLAGDTSVMTGLGYGNTGAANRAALQHAVTQLMAERGYTPEDIAQKKAEFAGLMASERRIGTQAAAVSMFAIEAQKMGENALEQSKAVSGRIGFIPFNEAEQLVKSKRADPALATFVAANNAFINTYAKAITPVGAAHDSDKQYARAMLSTAFTQREYEAVVRFLIDKELDAAKKSPQQAKENLRNKGGTAITSDGWKIEKVQ